MKYTWTYRNRGEAYLKKGDTDRAIADLTEAIHLAPGDYRPYLLRGDAYKRKGDINLANADYSKAKEPKSQAAVAPPEVRKPAEPADESIQHYQVGKNVADFRTKSIFPRLRQLTRLSLGHCAAR